jgi:hypothetical protein
MDSGPKKKSKKRETWPRIKQIVNHGKTLYLCDARIKGRGERRFFETKKEAEGWQQQQRIKRQNEGGKAFDGELAATAGTLPMQSDLPSSISANRLRAFP